MLCPSCKKAPDSDWFDHFPPKVAADFSPFIDCTTIFTVHGILRCYNCGAYFETQEDTEGTHLLTDAQLPPLLRPSLCARFQEALSFPPDLTRVITNELALGNETAHVAETDDQIVVLTLRYRFLDGHIVSSWIDYQKLPDDGPWDAGYYSFATKNAVAVACSRLIK